MSTTNGSKMELHGRFLGVDGNYVIFLVMPGARQLRIPYIEESTGAWRTASPGADIALRVSTDFCVRSGLFDGAMGSRPAGGAGAING